MEPEEKPKTPLEQLDALIVQAEASFRQSLSQAAAQEGFLAGVNQARALLVAASPEQLEVDL